MITCQELPGTAESRLHLIGDKEYVSVFAHIICFPDITFIGYIHTGFALNGFNKESGDVRIRQRFFKSRQVIVRDGNESRSEGSVILSGVRISRH